MKKIVLAIIFTLGMLVYLLFAYTDFYVFPYFKYSYKKQCVKLAIAQITENTIFKVADNPERVAEDYCNCVLKYFTKEIVVATMRLSKEKQLEMAKNLITEEVMAECIQEAMVINDGEK